MEEELENPATTTAAQEFADDIVSCCSTPYVSAPSSPGRDAPLSGYYYSAPASPMHFMLSAANNNYPSSSSAAAATDGTGGSFDFDFDFSATLPSSGCASPESMTSADELFFNGQIRPMKLSSHLRRPQLLSPLIESEDDVVSVDQTFSRGRDLKFRAGSLRRRARSMSPMRTTDTTPFHRETDDCKFVANTHDDKSPITDADADTNINSEEEKGTTSNETTACASRSSSAGRSSKRWVFLKEFLYRSKSEGRNNDGHKFWGSLSFSPVKDKKMAAALTTKQQSDKRRSSGGVNKEGKRRAPSAHEVHYTAKRAQAEEMRKKTFLPYRQGLFGCLGFSSKSYGAINGFARAFNTVSSR